MFFKKKKTEKGKEYFGEDILLQDIPRQIFGEIAHFTYDVELKRQESILTQSSNMLVFISLISAAFCTILPSAFSLFEKQKIELLCFSLNKYTLVIFIDYHTSSSMAFFI